MYENQYKNDSDYEDPLYSNPGPSDSARSGRPPISSAPPNDPDKDQSRRSTPDLLNKFKNLFNDEDPYDPGKNKRKLKDAQKVRDNLQQSYEYFKAQHAKVETEQEKNKVLNAAHRHYEKSKKSHKKHVDVVEAAYLEFLESVRTDDLEDKNAETQPERRATQLANEYKFFLDQYQKAESEEEREAANTATHRYFTLQYQGCRDDTERAMSSVAYQNYLDNRTENCCFGGDLPLSRNSVELMFKYYLKNFNNAKSEEERVEAMESAHDYFMSLTNACSTDEELQQLGTVYQGFLASQKKGLSQMRETQAYQSAMMAKRSSSSSKSASRERKTSKKTSRTVSRTSSPLRKSFPPDAFDDKSDDDWWELKPLPYPIYYVRWLYFCLFFQLLFLIGIVIIFFFGAFAFCWLRYTAVGFIILVLVWILLIIIIILLGLFAPKRHSILFTVIWIIVLTIVLSIALALTSSYFATPFILIGLILLAIVFLLTFVLSFLPIGYSGSRLLFAAFLAFVITLIGVIIYLSATHTMFSFGWVITLIVVLIIVIWVAIDAALSVSRKFHDIEYYDWMFGAVCCYSDVFIVAIHMCCRPFTSGPPRKK